VVLQVDNDPQRQAFLERLYSVFGSDIKSVPISEINEDYSPKKTKKFLKDFSSYEIKGKIYAQSEEEIKKIRSEILLNWESEEEFISALVHYYVMGMFSPREKKLIKEVWDGIEEERVSEISASKIESIARELSTKIGKK
jgi:hypothetical protein